MSARSISGMNKSSKNIFTICPLQALVGVELVEVYHLKVILFHKKLSIRGVPYLEFKAVLWGRTTQNIIPGSIEF